MGAATCVVIIFISVLSVRLAAAEVLGLTEAQKNSWILTVYGLTGGLSLALILPYRQPLLLTGNISVLIFVTRPGTQLAYAELVGACVLTGATVLMVGVLRLITRLAAWMPVPIVFGLLAGAVVSFVTGTYDQLRKVPILVSSVFLAYLLSRCLLGRRVPAIFTAVYYPHLHSGEEMW
jgi:benzoate membrane transport protein